MKKVLKTSLIALTVAILLGGVMVGSAAAQATARESIPTGITTASGFIDVLDLLVDWVFVIFLIIAVIMIVLAGLQFVTGGGDPGAVQQARTKLIWAAVGIAVAVLSRGVPAVVRDIIGQ